MSLARRRSLTTARLYQPRSCTPMPRAGQCLPDRCVPYAPPVADKNNKTKYAKDHREADFGPPLLTATSQSDRRKSRIPCCAFVDSALKLLITWLASEAG